MKLPTTPKGFYRRAIASLAYQDVHDGANNGGFPTTKLAVALNGPESPEFKDWWKKNFDEGGRS